MIIKYNQKDKTKKTNLESLLYSFSIEINKIETCIQKWLTLWQVNKLLEEYTFSEIKKMDFTKKKCKK